jgi:phage virion morphogenesis protein
VAGTAFVEIETDDRVSPYLDAIRQRMGRLQPAMSLIGEIVRTSIVRNFEKEGRPTQWTALSAVTEKIRKGAHPILRRQGFAGGLMGSINVRATDDHVIIGTNKKYAAVHQFGAKKGAFGTVEAQVKEHVRRLKRGKKTKQVRVKAHTRKMLLPWGNIPARPFMAVQPEDWDEIRETLSDYLLNTRV